MAFKYTYILQITRNPGISGLWAPGRCWSLAEIWSTLKMDVNKCFRIAVAMKVSDSSRNAHFVQDMSI